MMLDEEMRTFELMRADLLRAHPGEYVVIQGTKLIGVYAFDEEAFVDAMLHLGRSRPFLLRRISIEDESLDAPALVLGLLDPKLAVS
jgi:hypothetical protein